jgi:transposase
MSAHPDRFGNSLNVVLAVSPTMGVVAYMVYPGRMNHNVFYLFLRLLVLPALAQGTAKFLMVDNHKSHKKQYIKQFVNTQGHVYQFRPTHSPDFSPVELCFADIKAFVKQNEALITPSTLVEWVTYAVNQVSADKVKKYCARSYYLVTGEPYRPYMGDQ